MTWSRTCDYCTATFCPGDAPRSCRHHESTGFGAANTEWYTLCSHECRARLRREFRGDDRPQARTTETETDPREQADGMNDPPLREPEQSDLTWVDGEPPAWADRRADGSAAAEAPTPEAPREVSA